MQFWKEIGDNYDSKEIVEDQNQRGYGVGLLCHLGLLIFVDLAG